MDAAVESAARMLLTRYGVVFRDLVARESNIPKWGVLLRMLRRLEDRGEVRGGRFVSGFGGEQFALPDVVESLRDARNRSAHESIAIAGADPMNLMGILIPGERVPAVPGRFAVYRDGTTQENDENLSGLRPMRAQRRRPIGPRIHPVPITQPTGSLRLF